MADEKRQIKVYTSIKVKLDNCARCLLCWKDDRDEQPVCCAAVPNMFESDLRLDDVRQLDEYGSHCRTPPDWCPLRRGKVIVEGEL